MSTIDIATQTIEPIRHTFKHVAQRLGSDRPASRYQEGTFDIQSVENFHYRPTWAPDFELHDYRRTAIVLDDWYALVDPRQYYYGTYNFTRAKTQEQMEAHFSFVDKNRLLENLDETLKAAIVRYFMPLRHVAWGANMNNCEVVATGYGAALTQSALFAAMDQLAIAQYISRIGLLLDGQSGESLKTAKSSWLEDEYWQPLRHLLEDSFVIQDVFELLMVQNLVIDGLLYPFYYQHWLPTLTQHAPGLLMVTDFMPQWFTENSKWVNAILQITAKASENNQNLLSSWRRSWQQRTLDALAPLVQVLLPAHETTVLAELSDAFHNRCEKLGI